MFLQTAQGYPVPRTRRSGEMPAWSWGSLLLSRRDRCRDGGDRRPVSEPSKKVPATEESFRSRDERAVGEAGDQRAGEKELVARERKRQKLDIVEMPATVQQGTTYAAHVQARVRLICPRPVGQPSSRDPGNARPRLPRRRFRPAGGRHLVYYRVAVEHYRAAHILHMAQKQGDIGTEAQREAFVHYRELFEKLLAPILRPIRTRQRRHGA